MSDTGFGDLAMLDLFRAELETHVPALNDGLLSLEKDPNQAKVYEALMRAAHSVKGAARIVGVDAAARIAHVLEDCFVSAQNGRLSLGADAVDVLLRGVDALSRVGGSSPPFEQAIGGPDALARLIDDLAAIRDGTPRASIAPSAPTPAPAAPPAPRDLDGPAAEALRESLAMALAAGRPANLDFASIREVGPEGLALLVALAKAIPPNSPKPELADVPPAVRELLRLTRLDESFALTRSGG